MAVLPVRIQAIKQSIPSGYLMGRISPGAGPAELFKLSDLTPQSGIGTLAPGNINGGTGGTPSNFVTLLSAAALGGNRAVTVNSSGQAAYASTTSLPDGTGIIGLTATSVSSSGNPVSVQTAGIMTEPSWSWTPGLPVFVAGSGALTQTPPTLPQVWCRTIGIAISATAIDIDPQPVVGLA